MPFSVLSPAATQRDAEGNKRKYKSKDCLPFAPFGERCLVMPNAVNDKTEGGIILADESKTKSYSGRLMAAGLDAMDKLYDGGVKIGDEVSYGKYSGVSEEWTYLEKQGSKKNCQHEDWSHSPRPRERIKAYECNACGAIRHVAEVEVVNVGDIIGSVESAERLASGECVITYGKNAEDGSTQHFIKWKDK